MIVATVVLTNAAQAKCFPLSMPITYICSHTSDLEPQLCLELNGALFVLLEEVGHSTSVEWESS